MLNHAMRDPEMSGAVAAVFAEAMGEQGETAKSVARSSGLAPSLVRSLLEGQARFTAHRIERMARPLGMTVWQVSMKALGENARFLDVISAIDPMIEAVDSGRTCREVLAEMDEAAGTHYFKVHA